ncbi:related to DNA Polymerase iota (POLI) [Ustilago trichophora]|uniref:Related to DNA Polymerase iota (POLI) n=1 Tax=Ustilago trichophora TaxID=86804 RepID=A0A5C3DW00_9BASI|nr:related to DNA Polymerase iota (POLI) [Ustilago trichophora]
MTGRSPSTSPSKLLTSGDSSRTFLKGAHDAGSSSRLGKRQRLSSNLTADAAPVASGITSRVIIALDLDAFYVAACRKRDPSLIGIPIGIQQKALVATISYEARAAGVNKLDSIKDALKICPEMVLVNGEDLTYFRQVSSQVWRLVRSIVWEKRVEKLGMDELFCDVTEMVDHHLASLHKGKEGERWFDLNPPGEGGKDDGYGFSCKAWPSDSPGHTHPSHAAEHLEHSRPDWWQQRMLAAAQLALYLRQRISNEVGLTCSAGIAPSKSIAKLVGALHKPNQQTAFCPSIAGSTATEEARLLHHINTFLDPLDLRKLPGFGRVVVDKIRDHLHPDPNFSKVQSNGRARPNFMDPINVSDDEGEKKKVKVTVGTARKMLSLEQMVQLFGEVIGPRLWALVCGRDTEPVIPAPDFPLQLSIEDTYPYPSLRGPAIHAEILRLSLALLRRLELELTIQPRIPLQSPTPLSQETVIKNESVTIRDYPEDPPPPPTGKGGGWLRYPLKLRLSVRQGWNKRVSKQTKMPVEIFELDQPRDVRAAAIAKACRGLLRALIGGDDVVGDGMNLINIAALELSEKRPQRALGSFFAPDVSAEKAAKVDKMTVVPEEAPGREDIDEEFLASLPPELRDEIAREYGIHLPPATIVAEAEEGPAVSLANCIELPGNAQSKGKSKAISSAALTCSICGEDMVVWMQHDHELYPISGLPSCISPSPSLSICDVLSEEGPEQERDGATDEYNIDTVPCDICDEQLKPFMLVAHRRFHELQDQS